MKNRVETNPKGSNLVCLFLLSGSSDIQDVLEVVITELGVIVDPQRLSIASLHRVPQQSAVIVIVCVDIVVVFIIGAVITGIVDIVVVVILDVVIASLWPSSTVSLS